jgi:predicted PurR-regulated permease PerM
MKLFVQIVWDLPRISKGVKSLEQSAVRFAYREVAPPVQAFGNLVAQCFETQAVIALVNCSLTTLGLYALKVSRALEDFVILLRFAFLSPVYYLPDFAYQTQVLLH